MFVSRSPSWESDPAVTGVESERLADRGSLPLQTSLPLSVALGGGGMRGLAHVGVLEVLLGDGFQITELIGTSVGALIAVFYAVVGLRPDELARAGTELRSRHLLAWAALRRAPGWARRLANGSTGMIPEYLERLGSASFARLHHGVEHVGLLMMDTAQRELMVCHSRQPIVSLEDATRGAVAVPGMFPPRRCRAGDRELELVDAGVLNNMPVDLLLQSPFVPAQLLAVDISRTPEDRATTRAKIAELRRAHPSVPIAVVYPRTFGQRTFVSRAGAAAGLLASGRAAALEVLAPYAAPEGEPRVILGSNQRA